MNYQVEIAGVKRDLPLCKINDDLYIAAFICLGDAEISEACARELLKLVPSDSYDYMFTAESKGIPLIHEMARQTGTKKYLLARKSPKNYMPNPIHVKDESITTKGIQALYLGEDDAALMKGKRILVIDDVISTGGSLMAMEEIVEIAGGIISDRICVFAEGAAAKRKDIKYLGVLPVFDANGNPKED